MAQPPREIDRSEAARDDGEIAILAPALPSNPRPARARRDIFNIDRQKPPPGGDEGALQIARVLLRIVDARVGGHFDSKIVRRAQPRHLCR